MTIFTILTIVIWILSVAIVTIDVMQAPIINDQEE